MPISGHWFLLSSVHCTKNHIFLFQMIWKDGFSKKNRTGIWSFLYYQGRWFSFFPKNMILFFRQKMKDDLSQKNIRRYAVFFKCSEKMIFPKKLHWNIVFLVLSEKWYFCLPENMIFFLWMENDDLSQETRGNMIFSVYMYRCYKYDIILLPKKIKDVLLPRK